MANISELTVKLNAEEAIKGLKAIQREAKEATKALRELEEMRTTGSDGGERYMIFAYHQFCPTGGMGDCKYITDDFGKAKEKYDELYKFDYREIYDTQKREILP